MKIGPARMRALFVVEERSHGAAFVERVLGSGPGSFDAEHAGSVSDAMALLDRGPFDVVLLDLAVADARGPRSVTALQAASPGAAIVCMDHEENEATALEVVRAGAQDCLLRSCILQGCSASVTLLQRALRYAVQRKRVEEQIAFLADHDPLTGLTNRRFFRSALDQALARARRNRDGLAVLFLDLDRFKSINDRHGHDGGDHVLEEVARRLRNCLRERDIVSRLGGDEFLALVEELASPGDAIAVAHKIRRAMATPITVGAHRVSCSVSIGIAMSTPDHRTTPDALIARADTAMYRAKRRPHAGYDLLLPVTDGPEEGVATPHDPQAR